MSTHTIRRLAAAALGSLLATVPFHLDPPTAQAAPASVVNLNTYYNQSLGDYYLGVAAPARSGYVLKRVEGQAFGTTGTQPGGTIPLYRWWNAQRGDTFTTTTWTGRVGESRSGYVLEAIEAYVHAVPRMGTLPLTQWYSGQLADNWTTADPLMDPLYTSPAPDYTKCCADLAMGFIAAPTTPLVPLEQFGYDTMRPWSKRARGTRRVLLTIVDYSDVTTQTPVGDTETRLFGPGASSLPSYFTQSSNGAFTFSRVATARVTWPGTFAQAEAVDGNEYRRRLVDTMKTSANLAQYDTDGDNVVELDEVTILAVGTQPAGKSPGGQTGFVDQPINGNKRIQSAVAGVNERTVQVGAIHEMSHTLGTIDIYGSAGTCLSNQLTLMSCSGSVVDLDPWHKMRLGWIQPRVYPVGSTIPACVDVRRATSTLTPAGTRAILLYDPSVGPRDLLMVDNRAVEGNDTGLADRSGGLGVWKIRTDANSVPLAVRSNRARGLNGDRALWSIGSGADTTEFGRRGQSTLWRKSHTNTGGEFSIGEWLDDSGIRFAPSTPSSSTQATSVRLRQLGIGSALTQARLDLAAKSSSTRITVQGELGPQDPSRKLVLRRQGVDTTLTPSSWGCSQSTFQLPSGLAPGAYQVVVTNNANADVSNSLELTI